MPTLMPTLMPTMMPTMMPDKWQKAGGKEENAVKITFFLIFSWHFKL